MKHAVLSMVMLIVSANSPGWTADSSTDEQLRFFEAKIHPILIEHCYECHSAKALLSNTLKGNLQVDTRSGIRAVGDSGTAVVPGKPDESLIISSLRHENLEMPPKGKLPDHVIADFVKWVEMGAPDSREGKAVEQSQIDYEKAGKHWSFRPIEKHERPRVRQPDWCLNEIDYFTLSKMEQHHLQPVRPAAKRELIRRATLDLIGLPPSAEQVEEFLNDESVNAFEKVIARLLESEHYGERWGRYWLDVARYSEDQAHTFSVRENSNGFRYRDWVISAFNADMPYDQFVKLQIAGDLLNAESKDSYDHLVALGLFGLGAQYYKNSDAAKAAADELDDRVDTLTRGFLGLTVSCARCHDHKFDPIPTQDYYSIAGVFRSSKLHNAPLCTPDEVQAYDQGQQRIKKAETAVAEFLAIEKSTAAESKVGEIARYMEAVWLYQVAKAEGPPPKLSVLAQDRGLNETLLQRWIQFLAPKQKGKVVALDAWFALSSELTHETNAVPSHVSEVVKNFQERVQSRLNDQNGVAIANLVAGAETDHEIGRPRFVTPVVTKARPTAAIDVEILGAKQLFLVVSDAGNGKSCDHADWIEPKLVGKQGELNLTDLKWVSLEGTEGRINKNHEGKPIRVGGKKYSNGIGVHAPTVIAYDLPDGYDRFKAIGGLDNSGSDQAGGCGDQASIQFSIYTEKPLEIAIITQDPLLDMILGKEGPLIVSDTDIEIFLSVEKQIQWKALRADVEQAKANAPAMYAVAHSYAEAKAADMKVFVRGNPANEREIAPRRFLRILAGEDRPLFQDGSGRRELAGAIASADNPLTARVMVNRIWQHHFGRGIVGTSSDFGTQGEPPTHPELLDYLAARFIESGWSIKSLHSEIMRSATYRLSTSIDAQNAEIDGDNRFLWQMSRRRLDVEAWRDALLDVSGRLDRQIGGPSTNLKDANNARRTVYAKISRHELDSLLRLFDFPDANITSAIRSETTVPQQQLFVLNSPFMIEQAKAFSARLHEESPANDESRIRRAFMLAYARPPSDLEVELGLAYLGGEQDSQNQLSLWQSYAQILLGANEFMYID
jgi:hypothetical protein